MSLNLHPWEPFFTTVGTSATTLAGLLFVSLSLNREKMLAQETKTMLRLAQLSFADFLYVLAICAFFLIPDQGNIPLAAELLFLGLRRSVRLFHHARAATQDASHKIAEWQTLRSYALHIFCAVGLIGAAVLIYLGKGIAPYAAGTIAITLMINASWNTWLLLVMEKDYAKRA